MTRTRKILTEERVTAGFKGKVVIGVQRILEGPKGTFHQEVVYRGRVLGDLRSYPVDEYEKMLNGAKMLLSELAGQGPEGC